MRIGIAGLSHETNTFAMEKNDSMDCVHARHGEEAISGVHPKSFIGGFVEAGQRDGVELVPAVAISFAHGGIIGREVFEQCRAMIRKIFFALRAKSTKITNLPLKTRKIFGALRAKKGTKSSIYPLKITKNFYALRAQKYFNLPLEIHKKMYL